MKNPLHYQLSEYDCGPTAMLNAISFLFEREEIPPEIIRNIMLYSLDCYGSGGAPGKAGTSRMAMMFLANWLDGFGRASEFRISARYVSGKAVHIGQESQICDALVRGGCAVVRLFYEVEHYVMLSGMAGDRVKVFDPWYVPVDSQEFSGTGVALVSDHPQEYNRLVPASFFNREGRELYALGSYQDREAVLLFNERTKKTAADTIEYFI